MKKDYRYMRSEIEQRDIIERYKAIEEEIKLAHTKRKVDFYNQVKGKYKNEFIRCMDNRCSYCGKKIYIAFSIEDMEIDHFYPKSRYKIKKNAGKINNLVPSCRTCNRLKSDFVFDVNKFHPITGKLSDFFYIDEFYRIAISPSHYNDNEVKSFYDKLMLGREWRRIDFSFIKLSWLIKKLKQKRIDVSQIETIFNQMIINNNFMTLESKKDIV